MGTKEILVTATLCVAVVAVAVLAMMPSPSCSVVYDSNTGPRSGDTCSVDRCASGDTVRIPDCGFCRPGFTFVCWNTSSDGTGDDYLPGDGLSVGGDLRLYACWCPGEFSQHGDELVVDEVPAIDGDRHVIDASDFLESNTLTIPADTAVTMSGASVDLLFPGDVRATFGAETFAAMTSAADASGSPLSITVDACPSDMTDQQTEVAGYCDIYRITIDAGTPIETFDGVAEFVLPHTFQGAEVTEVWCISDDGSVEVMSTEVGEGTVSFTTPHLSLFAVADMVPVHCSVRSADGQSIPEEILALFSVSVSPVDAPAVHHDGMVRVGDRVTAGVQGSCDGYVCTLELDGVTRTSDGNVVTGMYLSAVAVVSRMEGGLSVTVAQPSEGGTISVQSMAHEGTFVSVTSVPEEGYVLRSLSVACDDPLLTVDPTLSGFTMPSCPVKVTAAFGRGTGMHKITLPAETRMYAVTASESSVEDGGSFRIQLTVSMGYVKNDSFALRVNGSALDLDSLDRCTVSSVHSDQTVTVEGIENAVSHGVSVPSEQVGYVLSVDRDRIPEEESYTMTFSVSEGYRKGAGFSVSINGTPVDLSSGSCLVKNVLALQRIDVEGVELMQYSVSAGANTVLMCGGSPVTVATMMDVLSVVPAEGYELPASYSAATEAMETVSPVDSGYTVSGDTVFPSVWSVTAGRNTSVSAGFVVSGESVVVSANAGYELPDDYYEQIESIVERDSDNSIIIEKNASLPAIHYVIYETSDGASSVPCAFYVDGTQFDQPTNPIKQCYSFSEWLDDGDESFFVNQKSSFVTNDVHLSAVWIPDTYSLSFGTNVRLMINGSIYTSSESPIDVTVEDIVSLRLEVSKPNNYDLHLKDQNVLINEGIYTIRQNTEFKGIVEVRYSFPNVEYDKFQYIIAGDPFVPLHYSKLSFTVPEYKMFNWWYLSSGNSREILGNEAITTESDIRLIACLSYRIDYDNIVFEEVGDEYQITIGAYTETLNGNHIMITGSTTKNSITIYEEYCCWIEYTLELHDVNINWPSHQSNGPIVNYSNTFEIVTTGTTVISVNGIVTDLD